MSEAVHFSTSQACFTEQEINQQLEKHSLKLVLQGEFPLAMQAWCNSFTPIYSAAWIHSLPLDIFQLNLYLNLGFILYILN